MPALEVCYRAICCAGRSSVPKCILIADDNLVMRKTLRRTLERIEGWEVCGEAANGRREAVAKAQQLKPDLVLPDLSMPVMNGLEAARELKRLLPSVPLLMFTNYRTDHVQKEALSAGVTAVVSKSDSVEVLVSSIQALLEPVS
jgi:two-component system nitrate/nitrite response regulator NarL